VFSQNTNKKFRIAGIASTKVILLFAPIAMASNDDYRNHDHGHMTGIVPLYTRDMLEANRSKGW
jgi:hypothetical protein